MMKGNKITKALYTIANFNMNYQLNTIMLSTKNDVDQSLTIYNKWMASFVGFHTYLMRNQLSIKFWQLIINANMLDKKQHMHNL